MNIKSIRIFSVILVIIIFLIGCDNNMDNDSVTYVSEMKVIINNDEFVASLEKTNESNYFYDNLPLEFTMKNLNSNEKYVYTNMGFMTKPVKVNKINSGDIMLYGDDCIVIFYKSFDTTYSYTKIGHINNLPDLGSAEVSVKFIKE